MFQIYSWPDDIILHLDGDAFFASVVQATHPSLRGKPVVTGGERSIATAVSYEAKEMGIIRGMRTAEIKKYFPSCVIVDSDYSLYQLFSDKMFEILSSFTPEVEHYSIDEGFANLKGLQRPLNKNYGEIGKAVKDKIENSLGITVSVGISLTKSLAKLASNLNKPSGLTVINGRSIEKLLQKIPLIDIWGIGSNTAAYLNKLGIKTALEFASLPEIFIKKNLSKPFLEIWNELRGQPIYRLNLSLKTIYKSICKSQTFYPPTNDFNLLWSRISRHIENAFTKARNLNYQVGKLLLFLKKQDFSYSSDEIRLLPKTDCPFLIREQIKEKFFRIYQHGIIYRSTGCIISDLTKDKTNQLTLFNEKQNLEEKIRKIYPLIEAGKVDFGTSLFETSKKISAKKERLMKMPLLSLSL